MSASPLGFGAYYPVNSPIHQLDPRIKIIVTFLLMTVVFTTTPNWVYFLIGGLLMIIMKLGKVTLICLRRLYSIWVLLVVMTGISMVLTTGRPLFPNWPFLPITYEGFILGIQMTSRLMIALLISSLLTLTTSPFLLTQGIEAMLNPLKKIGAPISEIAMIIQLSLRFIPTFMQERDKIMKAQAARGYTVDKKFIARSKGMLVLVVPLLSSAFRRVDELANAMDARGYVVGMERSSIKKMKMRSIDYWIMVAVIMFVVGMMLIG